jgi:lipopolysaccharide biosynthesis glycosyltransferase
MVNVLFCGNAGVFDGMLTCALSMLMRTASEEPFRFFVFTMDLQEIKPDYAPLSDAQAQTFKKAIRAFRPDNDVTVIDVGDLYRQHFSGCPNEGAYCSPYTLIRLFADLVPGIPEKLLYLDADILFNRDVHLLYDTDVRDYEFAAAPDHYGKYLIHPHYINAGVLLFNMTKARETGLFETARGWIKRKKLVFADQSALIRAATKRKVLPQRFNDQKFLHKHTVVRHFSKRLFYLPYPHTENIKQWQIDRVHKTFRYHQFDDIYEAYTAIRSECEVN